MPAYLPPAHSPVGFRDVVRASVGALASHRARSEASLRDLLSERFEAEEVVLCGSGTQALELAIRASVRVGADPARAVVALPAYSCFDLASAAVGAGVGVAFYDLDERTLSPRIESVVAALDAGATIVVAVHLYGFPVAWDEIQEVVAARGAVLIEDAAQGAGASWRGRPVGSFGALSVLSFGRGKGWTGGGGGALLLRSRDGDDPVQVRWPLEPPGTLEGSARAGKTLAQWMFGRPGLYGIPARIPALGLGETTYHPPRPIASLPDFSTRLAALTAESSAREASVRRERGAWLEAALFQGFDTQVSGLRRVVPLEGGDPGYLRLPLLFERGRELVEGGQGPARRLGIMPAYPCLLPDLPVLKGRSVGSPDHFPGARALVRELITLPTHRFVSPAAVAAIVEAVATLR